jgi:hypothetical protein
MSIIPVGTGISIFFSNIVWSRRAKKAPPVRIPTNANRFFTGWAAIISSDIRKRAEAICVDSIIIFCGAFDFISDLPGWGKIILIPPYHGPVKFFKFLENPADRAERHLTLQRKYDTIPWHDLKAYSWSLGDE